MSPADSWVLLYTPTDKVVTKNSLLANPIAKLPNLVSSKSNSITVLSL